MLTKFKDRLFPARIVRVLVISVVISFPALAVIKVEPVLAEVNAAVTS